MNGVLSKVSRPLCLGTSPAKRSFTLHNSHYISHLALTINSYATRGLLIRISTSIHLIYVETYISKLQVSYLLLHHC